MTEDLRVYELWIEYLREAGQDSWTAEVQRDFAGCLEAKSVQQWIFEANYDRALFFDSGEVVPTVVEIEQAGTVIAGRQITVVIDITAPDDDIAAGAVAYARLYRDVFGWKRPPGRPKFEPHPAKYKLASRPDVQALQTTLDAYRLIQANPKQPLWKLAEGMIGTHGIAPKWKNQPDGADRRAELSNIMSRYRVRAEQLLAGVRCGVFP